MNKLAVLKIASLKSVVAVLALASVATSTFAAEKVGATNSQNILPATLAYASAETGTNDEWAIGPVNGPVTADQHKRLTDVAETLNDRVSQKLAVDFYLELEQDF